MLAALQNPDLVNILARRDAAQREGFPDHDAIRSSHAPRPAHCNVPQPALEQHRADAGRARPLQLRKRLRNLFRHASPSLFVASPPPSSGTGNP
jgi:hypothetical protein